MVEPLVYETVKFNETIGPFRYFVPADYNERRLKSISVDNAAFLENGDGRFYAEPSFLCGQHSWVIRQRYSWGGSVHAKCEVQFLKPVFPGTHITVTAEVVDKYERRGGHYVVFQMVTVDEEKEEVARVKNTMLLNLREVLEYKKKMAADKTKTEEVAERVPGPDGSTPKLLITFGPKTIRREDILSFFQTEEAIYGVHPCIHNDEAIAKRAGLADIVAPGRYLIAIMNGMFGNVFGKRWFRSAKYSVSFMSNLLPGIVAQSQGTLPVSAPQPGESKEKCFDVLCQDVSGKKLLSGTVSVETD
jgi:acyl dehydratase